MIEAAESSVEQRPALEALLGRAGWIAALLLPGVALIYLSFHAGGYFPSATGFATIFFAQALLLRTVLAERPFDGIDRRLMIPILGLALFAAWQLASALWSHATARAIDGYDRTLLYLLAFLLFGSMAGTVAHLRWLLRGLAAAIATVCVIGLVSRLLPNTWPTTLSFAASRLSYPLTYWNAEGLLATLGLILCLHLTCDGAEYRVVRVLAAAVIPALAATLLLTFSRGAIAVGVIGIPLYALLARPRGLLTGVTSVAPSLVIALRSTYDATLLATNDPTTPAAVAQGHHVAKLVGASVVLAALLRLAMLAPEARLARLRARYARRWRRGSLATMLAAGLAAIVAFFALGAPGYISRQYDNFVHGTAAQGPLTRDRLTSAFNDGRLPTWKVGIRAFDAQPLHGQGAGAFQLYFDQHRPNILPVVDTHSLYIQTMAELGVVGLGLLLVALVGIVVLLALRIRGPDRAVYAAVLAAVMAWAIHAGFDWDWQMPAVTLWLFAAAGLALGRRAGSTSTADGPTWDRVTMGIGWLAIAVLPFLVTLSFQRVQSAGRALTNLDCPTAKRDALSSLSYLSVRPEPYAIIGFCDLRQGFATASMAAMQQAVNREPDNWEYVYGLALARAEDGRNPAATLNRAQVLDPFEPIIQSAATQFRQAGPGGWAAIAPGVGSQGLASGDLNSI